MKLNTIFLGIIATALAGPHVVAFGTSSIESFKAASIKKQVAIQCSYAERDKKWRADLDAYSRIDKTEEVIASGNSFSGRYLTDVDLSLLQPESEWQCSERVKLELR